MRVREVGIMTRYVAAGLADNLQIADHRVLRHVVLGKADFVHVVGVAVNAFDSFKNMAEIVGQARASALIPASPRSRNLSGNPFGVSTSTVTPSSWRNSLRIAPMSNIVASGAGSTRMSRSLSSVSLPCKTEPNTLALEAR